TRNPADGRFVADIGGAESAGAQTAQVPASFHDDRPLAHARGLHRRRHAPGGAAVNADIRFDDFGGVNGERWQTQDEETTERYDARLQCDFEGASGPAGVSVQRRLEGDA